jgi:hypothetical protein
MNAELIEEIVNWALHNEGCPREMMFTHWDAWSAWQKGFYKGVMMMRIEMLKELKKEELKNPT